MIERQFNIDSMVKGVHNTVYNDKWQWLIHLNLMKTFLKLWCSDYNVLVIGVKVVGSNHKSISISRVGVIQTLEWEGILSPCSRARPQGEIFIPSGQIRTVYSTYMNSLLHESWAFDYKVLNGKSCRKCITKALHLIPTLMSVFPTQLNAKKSYYVM